MIDIREMPTGNVLMEWQNPSKDNVTWEIEEVHMVLYGHPQNNQFVSFQTRPSKSLPFILITPIFSF
jgi:hypothetical protein